MHGLRVKAGLDYNGLIAGIKRDSIAYGMDTIVSVIECGHTRLGKVKTVVENSSITALSPIHDYLAEGGCTPLFDSVGQAIEICQKTPDFENPEVAFMVTTITDGMENASVKWGPKLGEVINQLQGTDRWTFTFRVPQSTPAFNTYVANYKRDLLAKLAIPEGNIAEWEMTERGFERSSQEIQSSFSNYYADLKSGKKATGRFFTNLAEVKISEIKKTLQDVSQEVQTFLVKPEYQSLANHKGKIEIKPFIEMVTKQPLIPGQVFYELRKPEKKVQVDKLIAIKHRGTGKVYAGAAARQLLGLSTSATTSVAPGDHGDYIVFIQSKSVNRYLPLGSQVLYWPIARS